LLRKDKEKAEMATIKLIKERNIFLERKIDERTKELQKVNAELQESNRFKDKLFSIIAHDMRTPIASLKVVLQLADRDMLDSKRLSNFLFRIRKNTEQVQRTMDNLLNWSISQMGIQRYQPEVLEIRRFLEDHLALYEAAASAKEITTVIDCAEGIKVIADKNQLALIIRNLIDNAIKFTPLLGLVKIELKIEHVIAYVSISNSGTPISAEAISKILGDDKNVIDSTYGTAYERGTGLGLQLCKEFIKNMNSHLKIENLDGSGDVTVMFSFGIPLYSNYK
jgi:signal transduction histidine kinase